MSFKEAVIIDKEAVRRRVAFTHPFVFYYHTKDFAVWAHGAKKGNHTAGGANGNRIGNNLIGTWGVQPIWAAAGNQANSYNTVQLNAPAYLPSYEAYLCIRCHSAYAYDILPPFLSGKFPNGDPGYESDPTADFNIRD